MIIIETPDPQKSHSVSSLSDIVSVGSSQRPPSYRSAGSRRSLQPMLDADPPCNPDPPLKPKKDRRCRRAALYILSLYAVLSIAVAIPYIVTHVKNESSSPTPYQRMRPPDSGMDPSDAGTIPVIPVGVPVADGKVLGCNIWDYTYPYGYPDNLKYSRLTYCIPHTATDIWFHALNGPEGLVSGQFTVMLNPDDDELDYMVDVMVTYPMDDYQARNSTAVCLMQASDTWGIGFYTPPNTPHHDVTYQITFYVPHASNPLNLLQFTTFLPHFEHSFRDLNKSLIFGDVEIGGVASPVNGAIAGTTVNITTSQAPITGDYHASKSLVLQTSSAKIDTNITLGSIMGQDFPTSLFMNSDGGTFSATINLTASAGTGSPGFLADTGTRPQFKTQFVGQDSPVTLIFHHDDSVEFSDLTIQINTTLNRAIIILDDKFEGQFFLDSTNGTVLVSDLDGDARIHGPTFHEVFPDSNPGQNPDQDPYRRSLKFEHLSTSHARGIVKRGSLPPLPPDNGKVNLQIQNHLALIALGFVSSGQTSPPSFASFGVP
ncbi:hypothetical protein BU17DRAFT_89040 [Hysterangium stoloniferum]|nr:hypothetical protein BU17DRAFT_89040 [Hysterangium stoloniferum]